MDDENTEATGSDAGTIDGDGNVDTDAVQDTVSDEAEKANEAQAEADEANA